MKKIRVTIISDGYVRERHYFDLTDIEIFRDYSFYLLDMHSVYGDDATYRVEEVE